MFLIRDTENLVNQSMVHWSKWIKSVLNPFFVKKKPKLIQKVLLTLSWPVPMGPIYFNFTELSSKYPLDAIKISKRCQSLTKSTTTDTSFKTFMHILTHFSYFYFGFVSYRLNIKRGALLQTFSMCKFYGFVCVCVLSVSSFK